MSPVDTLINSLFDGRYRILRKLGAGGMANVYLAEDEDLGREVAIKILNERHAGDELFLERFRREAESAASLSHPNIVSIYDRGEVDGHPYIAMQVVEGRSLKDLIRTRGPLPVAKAIAYTQQMLSALRFAHRKGIVHRDIKPHNILVGPEERLTVTDFGIARAGASQMTEAGSIIGTAQYLSPEQAKGGDVTATADLYSVGVVLYEMLAGKLPFGGDTPIEVALKHLNDTPTPPSGVVPGIPPELDKVVLRALAKNSSDRYTSAEEFSLDLKRVTDGLPVTDETTEAATAVLARAPAGVHTQVLDRPAQRSGGAQGVRPPTRPPAYPPDYRHRQPPRRRRRSVFPWLLVLGLLAAAAVAGWYVYSEIRTELREAEPIAVPFVVGLQEDLAVRNITEAGFTSEVERQANADVEAGEVFEQRPEAGARLDEGDPVTIVVSAGATIVQVPRLAGLTFDEAAERLGAVGLEVKRRGVFSDTRPPGEVASQDPKPGEEVPEGAVVEVRVSKGRQTLEVPDVLGQDQASAELELEQAEFDVGVVTGFSSAPEGTVFAQSPDPGVEAAKGSTVQISVSLGPETAGVPDVVGLDRDSARAAIEDAGLTVSVQEVEVSNLEQDFIVQSQNPPAGVQAELETTVTITVGVFVEPPPPPPEEGGEGGGEPPPEEPPPEGGDG